MKRLFPVIFIAFFPLCSAQNPHVPDINSLKTEDDFAYYENEIRKCIEWLRIHPIPEDYPLRIRVSAFIRYWTTGTPTLTLIINTRVARPILKESDHPYTTDIFMAYYTGMLEYQIDNPGDTDTLTIQRKGIANVLQLYYYNKDILEDSEAIRFYLELSRNKELENWIDSKL